jgi:hypothetical protein
MDLKAHIDSKMVVVGDFNNPFSTISRSSRQKDNKDILDLKDIIDEMDLLMSTEYFIWQQHNIHSSQQPIEISPKQIIS